MREPLRSPHDLASLDKPLTNVLVIPSRRFTANPFFQNFCDLIVQGGAKDVRLFDVLCGRMRYDVVHLHFPDHIVTEGPLLRALFLTGIMTALLIFSALVGRPVVWMVHDVEPFRQRRTLLRNAFVRLVRRLTDGHIFLSRSSEADFLSRYPRQSNLPRILLPHTQYPTWRLDDTKRNALRVGMSIGPRDFVVGFLGDIKPYKGFDRLSLLPAALADGRRIRLLVAGRVDHGILEEDLIQQLPDYLRHALIRFPDRLSDEELSTLIQVCDVVCLPYHTGSNSGLAFNVLSNGGRVLASALPMFLELERELGPPWIQCISKLDASGMASALEAVATARLECPARRMLEAYLSQRDPKQISQQLVQFYDQLLQRTRKRLW